MDGVLLAVAFVSAKDTFFFFLSLPELFDTILTMNQSLGSRFIVLFTAVWVDGMQIFYQMISLEAAVQLLCLGGQAICSLKLVCFSQASGSFPLTCSLSPRGGSSLFGLLDCWLPACLQRWEASFKDLKAWLPLFPNEAPLARSWGRRSIWLLPYVCMLSNQ